MGREGGAFSGSARLDARGWTSGQQNEDQAAAQQGGDGWVPEMVHQNLQIGGG